MAFVKTVSNGDRTATFKAVALGHVVAIIFGLVSLLGAQQTWLWSASHERSIIVDQIKADSERSERLHAQLDSISFQEIHRRLSDLEAKMDSAQRQININTGWQDRTNAPRGPR